MVNKRRHPNKEEGCDGNPNTEFPRFWVGIAGIETKGATARNGQKADDQKIFQPTGWLRRYLVRQVVLHQ